MANVKERQRHVLDSEKWTFWAGYLSACIYKLGLGMMVIKKRLAP